MKKVIGAFAVILLLILVILEATFHPRYAHMRGTDSAMLPDDAYDAVLDGEKFYDTGTQEYLETGALLSSVY